MWVNLLMFALFVGIAVIGARETAHVRHQHQTNHKRRQSDH